MTRIPRIFIAAVLAAICAAPATAQGYRAAKTEIEPEPLEFRELFWFKDRNLDRGEIYRKLYDWDSGFDLLFIGSAGFDEKCYSFQAYGLDFGKTKGNMTASVNIHIYDGWVLLELKNIAVSWGNHLHVDLSKKDDRLNRNWLWRVNHDPKVVEAARERSREIFKAMCSSLDGFVKADAPIELERIK